MFKIGDLSRLAQVSVKTLRYYGARGLLKPVWIDRYTGYRYYAAEQLGRLNRIMALKDLGFSLEEIRCLLDESVSTEALRGMLRLRQAELERGLIEGRARLGRVEARLRYLDQEGIDGGYPVLLKAIEPQRVLALSGVVEGYGQATALLDEVRQTLRRSGPSLLAGSPLMARFTPDDRANAMQAEVGVPLGASGRGPWPAGLSSRAWEGCDMSASTLYAGDPAGIAVAYGALLRWASEGAYRPSSASLEVYIHGPQEGLPPGEWLTEIRVPVVSMLDSLDAREKERVMNPEITERPAFTVVGQVYRGKNEHGEIPAMWEGLNARWGEMEALQANPIAYGVCREMEPDGVIEYLAGIEVSADTTPPAGMARWEVPAQTYAVFPCLLTTIHQAYEQAYQVWLPTSGYRRASGPDFELYPATFEPEDPNSQEMFIYIPITR